MSEALRDKVIEVIQTIYDPELPVNIFDLGLIYEVKIDDTKNVHIAMTLTSPNCPVAQSLPMEVDEKVRALPGVTDVYVTITWTPKWNRSMMSEAAQLECGFL